MNCQICNEEMERSFKHHVVPKCKGGKATIEVCYTCNGQVHMLFNEQELAAMTLDELLSIDKMRKYIKWKQKHPGEYRHRMSQDVKKWKKYHR